MNKFIILAVLVGGFLFAGNTSEGCNVFSEDDFKAKIYFAKDLEKSDDKIDRRRRGKGSKGRRRGGSGLR
jgi:hypothetical protein